MSYFEVYNEKIHDLLVTRDEPNQRIMPVSGVKNMKIQNIILKTSFGVNVMAENLNFFIFIFVSS